MIFLQKFFLFIGVLSTQFYVFSSGLPQPSHLALLAFSFFVIIDLLYKFELNELKFIDGTKSLLLFVLYCVVLNVIFSIVEQDIEFQRSSIYMIYNLVVFFSILSYLKIEDKGELIIYASCVISLMCLFFLSVFDLGRFNYFPRFNAFFNDPNQMAFWAICTFVLVIFSNKINKYFMIVLFCMLLSIILASMSRSGLLAVIFVIVGVLFSYCTRKQLMFIFYISFVFLIGILLIQFDFSFYSIQKEGDIFDRLVNTDFREQAQIRGYGRFFDFSEYLIFGAGQGLDARFNSIFEIHSTWAGVFFYYGIIGLSFLIYFLHSIARNLEFSKLAFFMAPLFYSFSTYGLRTPIFWVILAVAFHISQESKAKNK